MHVRRVEKSTETILVSVTISGHLHHVSERGEAVSTRAGNRFVVDCGRVDYRFEADNAHLQ